MRQHRTVRDLTVLALALLLGGCFNAFNAFEPLDSNFQPQGRTIAVIPGSTNEMSVVMAQLVTESLQRQSRYQVMPQAQIAKTLGVYPQNIKGPFRSAYLEIDVSWDLIDRQTVIGIQRKLGVDYLYVVWAPSSVISHGGSYTRLSYTGMNIIAQLFESPVSKEVGRGTVRLDARKKDQDVLKESIDKWVQQLATRTGMARDTETSSKK